MRFGGDIGAAAVSWRVDDNDADFLSNSGIVEFVDGQSFADLVLTIAADTLPELDESFSVLLVNSSRVSARWRWEGLGAKAELQFLKSDCEHLHV